MLKGFRATEFGRNKGSKPNLLLKGSFPKDFLSPILKTIPAPLRDKNLWHPCHPLLQSKGFWLQPGDR